MSEPSAPSSCANCGEVAPADARFCARCGSPLEQGATAVIPPPPHETGVVPIAVVRSEPRFFGVLPPGLLLLATLVVLGVAVALFAAGRWALGLLPLGLALLGLLGLLEAARRAPDAVRPGRAETAVRRASGWGRYAAASYAARSRAAREVTAYRHRLRELAARRGDLLKALGEAAYAEDEAAMRAARDRLLELDEEARRVERELAGAVAGAEERIRHARLEVQPTEMVQVPEPYPPPDEGTPRLPEPVPEPAPTQVPEPYPPPDEGSPPGDPGIPEPSPPDQGRS